eukprot:688875-Pyramimonas_sp.AAC.1
MWWRGVQGHRAPIENLDRVQSRFHDVGYHGAWALATAAGKGDGVSAGVAVTAKSRAPLASPPA